MKLNQKQRYHLLGWLCYNSGILCLPKIEELVSNFDEFCNEEIGEWRIIGRYGIAGKIWNTWDRIYITGYSGSEIGFKSEAYRQQQGDISYFNQKIEEIVKVWA